MESNRGLVKINGKDFENFKRNVDEIQRSNRYSTQTSILDEFILVEEGGVSNLCFEDSYVLVKHSDDPRDRFKHPYGAIIVTPYTSLQAYKDDKEVSFPGIGILDTILGKNSPAKVFANIWFEPFYRTDDDSIKEFMGGCIEVPPGNPSPTIAIELLRGLVKLYQDQGVLVAEPSLTPLGKFEAKVFRECGFTLAHPNFTDDDGEHRSFYVRAGDFRLQRRVRE